MGDTRCQRRENGSNPRQGHPADFTSVHLRPVRAVTAPQELDLPRSSGCHNLPDPHARWMSRRAAGGTASAMPITWQPYAPTTRQTSTPDPSLLIRVASRFEDAGTLSVCLRAPQTLISVLKLLPGEMVRHSRLTIWKRRRRVLSQRRSAGSWIT